MSSIATFSHHSIAGEANFVMDPPFAGADVVTVKSYDGEGTTGIYPQFKPNCLVSMSGVVAPDTAIESLGYVVVRKSRQVAGGGRSASSMVREFHKVFGQPVSRTPGLIPPERAWLRYELIAEELHELHAAILAGDLVEIADALADLSYVVHGAALEWGIPLEDAVREVHSSNMSKLGEDGKPIYRDSDNKILKGPGFREPDLAAVLKGAGWMG